MERSESINELAKALVKVQSEMKPAVFDSVNPYYKSKYASLGAVIEAAKILAKHGLSYSQLPVSNGWYVGVESVLMHESGQFISQTFVVPMDNESKNPVQEAGKIVTYARRYALASMLGIYSDEDNDGNEPPKVVAPHQVVAMPADEVSHERPYTPEELKARLVEVSKNRREASDKQRNLLGALLSEFFAGDTDLRHHVQSYLLGATSVKDADGKLVNAAIQWLDIQKDSGGGYIIGETAKQELLAVSQRWNLE